MTDRALDFLRQRWDGLTDTELIEMAIVEKAYRDGWDGKEVEDAAKPPS